MNEYKVTMVIPVYNAEKYIGKCLDSVIHQSLDNYEVILVNDGSTDNSREICEDYAKLYPCINLVNKNNEGVSVARNVGIDKATGKYITFIDADDYIDTDFCSSYYCEAERMAADIVIGDYSAEIAGGGV